jgi:hypothetical protein
MMLWRVQGAGEQMREEGEEKEEEEEEEENIKERCKAGILPQH